MAWRTYGSFLIALLVMTFSAAQLWEFALGLRQGWEMVAQLVVGAISIALFLLSTTIVLRILYVTARPGAKR